MKIKITFLGTSQAVPTLTRNHTAIHISYANENILIDCGEGTQRQFRKARLNPCKLTRILITHWHGDHVLGLPGLLQTLALNNYSKTLHIYGPLGTKEFFEKITSMFVFVLKRELKVEVHEIADGVVFETPDFFVEARRMHHGTACLAYRFVEKDRVKLDKKKFTRYGLSESPILKVLKEKGKIKWKGKTIRLEQVSKIVRGRKITIILDTKLNKNCYEIAKNADLLICESTYSDEDAEKAKEYKHLTAKQAGEIAKKAKAKKLILTHISQRYEGKEKLLLKEAKKIFKNSEIAEDLKSIEI